MSSACAQGCTRPAELVEASAAPIAQIADAAAAAQSVAVSGLGVHTEPVTISTATTSLSRTAAQTEVLPTGTPDLLDLLDLLNDDNNGPDLDNDNLGDSRANASDVHCWGQPR